MLDVRKLRVLRELSERGTIAATAEALSFTPSAISQQLSALERETGVELLAREGRRLTLTEPARRLVARTDEVLAALEAAEADLEASVGAVRGTIALAAFPTAAAALVPAVVAGLRAEHPALEVRVEELEPHDSLPALRLGEVDVALAHDYDTIPRTPDPAVRRAHADGRPTADRAARGTPARGAARCDLADLAAERWIAGRPGTHCGTVVTTAGRAAGFEPEIAAHASEFATMLALVAAGLGVAMVPGLAATAGAAPGVVLWDSARRSNGASSPPCAPGAGAAPRSPPSWRRSRRGPRSSASASPASGVATCGRSGPSWPARSRSRGASSRRVDQAGVEVVARAERGVELVDVEPLDPAVRLGEGEHAPERLRRAVVLRGNERPSLTRPPVSVSHTGPRQAASTRRVRVVEKRFVSE